MLPDTEQCEVCGEWLGASRKLVSACPIYHSLIKNSELETLRAKATLADSLVVEFVITSTAERWWRRSLEILKEHGAYQQP